MHISVSDFATAVPVAGLAALGGAAYVFSEFDDAPGGMLIGLLLVVGAVGLELRVASRRKG